MYSEQQPPSNYLRSSRTQFRLNMEFQVSVLSLTHWH